MCIPLVFFAKSKRQNPRETKIILSTIPFESSNKTLQNLLKKKITRKEDDIIYLRLMTVKNSNRFTLHQTSWSHKRRRYSAKKYPENSKIAYIKVSNTIRAHSP